MMRYRLLNAGVTRRKRNSGVHARECGIRHFHLGNIWGHIDIPSTHNSRAFDARSQFLRRAVSK
jgi:hypothetical protein